MKKIPTIFMPDLRIPGRVYNAVTPECQWVFDRNENGDPIGSVKRKYDGRCFCIHDSKLWERKDIPNGETLPDLWRLIKCDDIYQCTRLWEPVDTEDPRNGDAVGALRRLCTPDEGTYELIGPLVRGNPENVSMSVFVRHDHVPSYFIPSRNFDSIRLALKFNNVYGFIFTHPDGRKAKINRTHYGLDRLYREIK